MKNFKFIIAIIVVFVFTTAYTFQQKYDYIDGNVLNLPVLTQPHAGHIPLPWISTSIISSLMFRTLLLPDSTLTNFSPDLVSKYSISDEGLVYRFTMKSNHKWSDGEPITAEDVIFSIQSALHTSFVNHLFLNTFKYIEYMETKDNILTIKLSEPHNNFIPVIAQFAIMPKHILKRKNMSLFYADSFWKNPVVSGLYKVGDIKSNEYFKLIRNEYYTGQRPKIDEILLHLDNNTSKIDYYHTNDVAEMVNFRAMRGFTENEIKMLYYRFIVYNMQGYDGFTNPAMQDVRVREAIAFGIDKNKLLYDIFFNIGDVVGNVYTLEDKELHLLEIERSKELLKEANYDMNRPLRIMNPYADSTSIYLAERIALDLQDVGFKTEVINATGGNTEIYSKREYDILIKDLAAFDATEWYLDYDTSNVLMRRILGGQGEFDHYLAEISTTNNPDRYATLMNEMSALGRELIYKVPLFTLNQSVYINTARVKLPKNFVFGNSWYHFDLDFANWQIKKD